jgi:uncharacterized protein
MYYLILAKDVDDSLALRKSARTAHLARLDALRSEGRLLTAGPMPAVDSEDPAEAGFTGSVIIAEFESLDDAKEWASADPYMEAGAYESVDVVPYKKVY